MNIQIKIAVRAFNRLNTAMMNELSIAEEYDAHFDGGEWSGAFHDQLQMEAEANLINRVAERFGISADELRDAIYVYQNEQLDHFYNSFKIRAPNQYDSAMMNPESQR